MKNEYNLVSHRQGPDYAGRVFPGFIYMHYLQLQLGSNCKKNCCNYMTCSAYLNIAKQIHHKFRVYTIRPQNG
jgi:hypothetical protein